MVAKEPEKSKDDQELEDRLRELRESGKNNPKETPDDIRKRYDPDPSSEEGVRNRIKEAQLENSRQPVDVDSIRKKYAPAEKEKHHSHVGRNILLATATATILAGGLYTNRLANSSNSNSGKNPAPTEQEQKEAHKKAQEKAVKDFNDQVKVEGLSGTSKSTDSVYTDPSTGNKVTFISSHTPDLSDSTANKVWSKDGKSELLLLSPEDLQADRATRIIAPNDTIARNSEISLSPLIFKDWNVSLKLIDKGSDSGLVMIHFLSKEKNEYGNKDDAHQIITNVKNLNVRDGHDMPASRFNLSTLNQNEYNAVADKFADIANQILRKSVEDGGLKGTTLDLKAKIGTHMKHILIIKAAAQDNVNHDEYASLHLKPGDYVMSDEEIGKAFTSSVTKTLEPKGTYAEQIQTPSGTNGSQRG